MLDKFDGGPVGVDNLAAAIGEERDTIEDVLEPFLIQQGFLQRTSRGRVATALSYRHFGLAPPDARRRPRTFRRTEARARARERGDRARRPFRFPVRVYYEDTDAAGVVYYANYLKFMERARTEWLAALGFPLAEFERAHGVVFVVHRCEIDYPAAGAAWRSRSTSRSNSIELGARAPRRRQEVRRGASRADAGARDARLRRSRALAPGTHPGRCSTADWRSSA